MNQNKNNSIIINFMENYRKIKINQIHINKIFNSIVSKITKKKNKI